ncbi:MAG TPA: UDP-N-acetylmuramate--L-alanine ligase [Verrucomicrobiae bacterium]|nr:UDP-N-acetylmuramate--L-alanine ligase [Verrucomicrobiae bacterium]
MISQNKPYLIGIGGIGVSALARLFLGMGKPVAGSDLRDSATVQELIALGIKVNIGHSAENITAYNPDVVIFSEDISPQSQGYAELSQAKKLGIPSLGYSQALGQLMEGHFQISVTGTNGKSTTTALLGLMLEEAGLDPAVVVGSKLSPKNASRKFIANARLGEGKYFVAEADEYHRHMMDQNPNLVVLTNVAEDHLDYYKDITEIKAAFEDFIKKVPVDGTVVYNADDHTAVEVGRKAHCHKATFGIHHYADLQAINPKAEKGKQSFDLHYKDQNLGRVEIAMPGLFNISNALASSLAALSIGVSFDVIKKVLGEFAGIWRRFEILGQFGNAVVVSDYAHHPAGVAGTIEAAKQFFPGKKILFVFQPHHRNRTKRLFGEFVESLEGSDNLILPEIFDVSGREHGENVSSQDLVNELKNKGVAAEFAADLDQTEQLLRSTGQQYDAIIMMGAGDIDLLARKLVNS